MPEDQLPDGGDIVIGMDGASPDGPIVYATVDPQGRITDVRAVDLTPDGRVVGRVLAPGETFPRHTPARHSAPIVGTAYIAPAGTPAPVNLEDFDLGRYTDLGYLSSDGVSWTAAEPAAEPAGPYAFGGLVHGPGTPATDDRLAAVLRLGEPHGVTIEQLMAAEQHARETTEERLALLGRAEFEARTEAAPAPDGDVLDRIDAAVAELCACGCGEQVPPDGASAYFASPDCQRRWHSARATNADAVYRRPDAAAVYVGADANRVPLNGDPPEVAAGYQRVMRRADPIPPCPDLFGAGYRRECYACRDRVVPHYEYDAEFDIREFGSTQLVRCSQPEVLMVCPRCRWVLPGPLLYADVYEDEGHLVLLLTDGQSTIRRRLRLATLLANEHRAPDVERTWAVMERELLRFRRQWIGRTLAAERIAMSVMNPTSAVRITGMI